MRLLLACTVASSMTVAVPALAQTVCFDGKLLPSDGVNAGLFGRFVEMDGEWAIIGSIASAQAPVGTGTVYVYRRTADGGWIEHQRLTQPDDAGANGFGHTGLIHGTTIVLPAVWDDTLAQDAGAIYIFERFDLTNHWNFTKKVFAPNGGTENARFGWSCAFDGQTLAASTYPHPSGTVHVMGRASDGTWTLEATLTSPVKAVEDDFGSRLLVNDGFLTAGARAYSMLPTGWPWRGAVFSYQRNSMSNAWTLHQSIFGEENDIGFGAALAGSGDRVLIGTTTIDPPQLLSHALSFRSYTRDIFGHLVPDGTHIGSTFVSFPFLGRWLDVYGDIVVKGDVFPYSDMFGKAEVHMRDPHGTWRQIATLHRDSSTASGCCPNYGFGFAVAIEGQHILIADRYDNTAGNAFGTVFSYMVSGLDCNANGTCDRFDIANGTSQDLDGNGVPDECERTPGDINGDGVVNVTDLLAVISAWGPCQPAPDPCPADIAPSPDGDGHVNVSDLLMVIANWG